MNFLDNVNSKKKTKKMEEKRRLPLWMLGASTAKTARKPLDADARTSDEVSVVNKSTKPRAKGVTQNQKNLLVKCESKRKKRGSVEKDVIEDQEIDVEKQKRGRVERKAQESKPPRKKTEKKYEIDSGDGNLALSGDDEEDDDDDLTMEDVLTIAKEFVKNDKSKNTSQLKPSEVEFEFRSKSSYARSPIHEETDSHHEHVEATSKITLTDSQMTGDPAQDMLDLFLGPLLKKPIAKEETSSINEAIVCHESKNQQHAAVVSDKPVILTKKKSSIRDAVAMLLG